jgi:exosortase
MSVETSVRAREAPRLPYEIVLVAVGIAILYYPLVGYLVDKWENQPEFSHGYLIPVISIYLTWRRRDEIVRATRRPATRGVWIVAAALALLLVANLGAVKTVACYSLIPLLIGVVLAIWGGGVLRLVLFPIVFLVFAIPIFTFVMTPVTFAMKLVAAKLSVGAVSAIGVPVYRDGAILILPHGALEVADACSGIRSLFALLALGAVYAYLFDGKTWERASLFLAGIPIAILANFTRVTFLTVVAYKFGIDASTPGKSYFVGGKPSWGTIIHEASGFAVFIVAFLILLSIGRFLQWRRRARTPG